MKCAFGLCPQYNPKREDNNCNLYEKDGTKTYCRHGFPDGTVVDDDDLLIGKQTFIEKYNFQHHPNITVARKTAPNFKKYDELREYFIDHVNQILSYDEVKSFCGSLNNYEYNRLQLRDIIVKLRKRMDRQIRAINGKGYLYKG